MKRINLVDHLLFAYYVDDKRHYQYSGKAVIKSSPNSNESFNILQEDLVEYAALLNGLFAKWNINTEFRVAFCGMDGWQVISYITVDDFNWLATEYALNPDKFDVCEDLHDYLMEHNVEETEDE